jgi:hypothetical protein
MQRPKTQKDVPLTDLCGQERKFLWEDTQKKAFQSMKNIMAQNTMLTYPEYDKPFAIYTNASKHQIGGVEMQNEKPLGFLAKNQAVYKNAIL